MQSMFYMLYVHFMLNATYNKQNLHLFQEHNLKQIEMGSTGYYFLNNCLLKLPIVNMKNIAQEIS